MRTKTITVIAAAILLLVPAGAAQALDNYVDNGGFEDFENGDPVDWRVIEGSVSNSSDAAEGNNSAQFSLTGSTTEVAIAQNISLENEDPPTPSGTSYELNFSAKFGTGSQNVATATAKVIWKDATGDIVENDTISIAQSPDFDEYEETFQAPLPGPGELPVTEAEIRFSLERPSQTSQTDANLFVDSVEFGPVPPSTS